VCFAHGGLGCNKCIKINILDGDSLIKTSLNDIMVNNIMRIHSLLVVLEIRMHVSHIGICVQVIYYVAFSHVIEGHPKPSLVGIYLTDGAMTQITT